MAFLPANLARYPAACSGLIQSCRERRLIPQAAQIIRRQTTRLVAAADAFASVPAAAVAIATAAAAELLKIVPFSNEIGLHVLMSQLDLELDATGLEPG